MGAEDAGTRATRGATTKSRATARKRTRRSRVIESDDEEEATVVWTVEAPASPGSSPPPTAAVAAPSPPPPPPPPSAASVAFDIDMEADISQLEPATFTTIRRGPPEPMLRLNWSHKVNLMGEKVLNPLIYMCEKCDCPVLSYGRMIPCKHVLCYDCASPLRHCWRCGERAVRVERAGLGKLFMCLHDGRRYDNNGCRRTYLSQRDLQAHINHRHLRPPAAAAPQPQQQQQQPSAAAEEPRRDVRRELAQQQQLQRSAADPRSAGHRSAGTGTPRSTPGRQSPSYSAAAAAGAGKQHQIPVISSQRTGNLITIPIQGQEPTPPEPQPPQLAAQYAGYTSQYGAPPAGYVAPQEPPPPAASYYQSTPPPAPPGSYGRPFAAGSVYAAPPPPQQPWSVTTPPPSLPRPPPDRRFYR